jgi:hypothetical protein
MGPEQKRFTEFVIEFQLCTGNLGFLKRISGGKSEGKQLIVAAVRSRRENKKVVLGKAWAFRSWHSQFFYCEKMLPLVHLKAPDCWDDCLTLCLHLLISASNLGRSFFFHLSPIP